MNPYVQSTFPLLFAEVLMLIRLIAPQIFTVPSWIGNRSSHCLSAGVDQFHPRP
jgi:hypothetical protein